MLPMRAFLENEAEGLKIRFSTWWDSMFFGISRRLFSSERVRKQKEKVSLRV
jgi:hypothetical protein